MPDDTYNAASTKATAIAIRQIYVNFMAAGFSAYEAMELTKTFFATSLMKAPDAK